MKFFPHHRRLGQGLKGHDDNWNRCCCFSYVLHKVKYKKHFPIDGIVVEYWHASVSYPSTFGMFTFFHLNWRAWIVIHTTSFSDSLFPIAHNLFILYRSFCGVNFAKECTILGLLYPVWNIGTRMTVEFVIIWSLHLSLLYELFWGMRSDNISSSSSVSSANSFNFWSKVGFFLSYFSHVHFLNST